MRPVCRGHLFSCFRYLKSVFRSNIWKTNQLELSKTRNGVRFIIFSVFTVILVFCPTFDETQNNVCGIPILNYSHCFYVCMSRPSQSPAVYDHSFTSAVSLPPYLFPILCCAHFHYFFLLNMSFQIKKSKRLTIDIVDLLSKKIKLYSHLMQILSLLTPIFKVIVQGDNSITKWGHQIASSLPIVRNW